MQCPMVAAHAHPQCLVCVQCMYYKKNIPPPGIPGHKSMFMPPGVDDDGCGSAARHVCNVCVWKLDFLGCDLHFWEKYRRYFQIYENNKITNRVN